MRINFERYLHITSSSCNIRFMQKSLLAITKCQWRFMTQSEQASCVQELLCLVEVQYWNMRGCNTVLYCSGQTIRVDYATHGAKQQLTCGMLFILAISYSMSWLSDKCHMKIHFKGEASPWRTTWQGACTIRSLSLHKRRSGRDRADQVNLVDQGKLYWWNQYNLICKNCMHAGWGDAERRWKIVPR